MGGTDLQQLEHRIHRVLTRSETALAFFTPPSFNEMSLGPLRLPQT